MNGEKQKGIWKQFEDEYYYTQCSIYTRVDGVSKIVERFQNYFARQMCKYLKKKKKILERTNSEIIRRGSLNFER